MRGEEMVCISTGTQKMKFTHQGLMFQSVDSKRYSERNKFIQSGIALKISSVDLTYTNIYEL